MADSIELLVAAMRDADKAFERVGGSTRHYVNECLVPAMTERGICVAKIQPEGSLTKEAENAIADFINGHPGCDDSCFETIRTVLRNHTQQAQGRMTVGDEIRLHLKTHGPSLPVATRELLSKLAAWHTEHEGDYQISEPQADLRRECGDGKRVLAPDCHKGRTAEQDLHEITRMLEQVQTLGLSVTEILPALIGRLKIIEQSLTKRT